MRAVPRYRLKTKNAALPLTKEHGTVDGRTGMEPSAFDLTGSHADNE
jgi:hypothetical protein